MADNCPKCGSARFDGYHCPHCGYLVPHIPSLKGYAIEVCADCGKEVRLPYFYGNGQLGKNQYAFRCQDCIGGYAIYQDAKDDWARKNGFLATSPERIAQKRNLDKWLAGEL